MELLAISVNSPCSSHKFCIALYFIALQVLMFRFLVNFFPFWNHSVPHSFLLFYCSVILTLIFLSLIIPIFTNYLIFCIHFPWNMQVVPSYTHVSPNGSTSLIDLAFLSTPTLLRSCSVIPPLANSDHFGLLLDIKWKTNTKQARSEKRKIWRYAHVCMMVLPVPGKMKTKYQIICESGDDEA